MAKLNKRDALRYFPLIPYRAFLQSYRPFVANASWKNLIWRGHP